MAINLNRATIIGRLGGEPEPRGEGLALRVATSERWRDKQTGEYVEKTQWHNVVIWNEHVVRFVSQYARKGDLVCVEGQLETRKWAAQDGTERYVTEIIVKFGGNVQIMSKEPRDEQPNEGRALPEKTKPKEEVKGYRPFKTDLDDEIPFAPEWR